MKKIITRTLFCEKCYKEGRPANQDEFIVFGGTSGRYMDRKSHCNGEPGFTPHIIFLGDINNPRIVKGRYFVTAYCGICEVNLVWANNRYWPNFINGKDLYLSKEDYEALLGKWRNTGYEII